MPISTPACTYRSSGTSSPDKHVDQIEKDIVRGKEYKSLQMDGLFSIASSPRGVGLGPNCSMYISLVLPRASYHFGVFFDSLEGCNWKIQTNEASTVLVALYGSTPPDVL